MPWPLITTSASTSSPVSVVTIHLAASSSQRHPVMPVFEPDLGPQVEVGDRLAHVGEDLGLGRVGAGPRRVEGEGEAVEVAPHVARQARVAVALPRAADVVVVLVDRDVVVAGLAQVVAGADPPGPGADDDDAARWSAASVPASFVVSPMGASCPARRPAATEGRPNHLMCPTVTAVMAAGGASAATTPNVPGRSRRYAMRFVHLGRFVIRARWWIIAVAVVFFVAAGSYGLDVASRLSSGGFSDPGSQERQGLGVPHRDARQRYPKRHRPRHPEGRHHRRRPGRRRRRPGAHPGARRPARRRPGGLLLDPRHARRSSATARRRSCWPTSGDDDEVREEVALSRGVLPRRRLVVTASAGQRGVPRGRPHHRGRPARPS